MYSVRFRFKKGAAILESTILYPFIVLATCCLLTIMIGLYTLAATKAECDIVVRAAAGSTTGTIMSDEEMQDYEDYDLKKVKGNLSLYSELTTTRIEAYRMNYFYDYKFNKVEETRFILHDECRFIRNVELISEGLSFVEGLMEDDGTSQQ